MTVAVDMATVFLRRAGGAASFSLGLRHSSSGAASEKEKPEDDLIDDLPSRSAIGEGFSRRSAFLLPVQSPMHLVPIVF